MKKRSVIVLFFIFLALAIGAIVSWRQQESKTQQIKPLPKSAAQPPSIELVREAPKDVVFSLITEPPTFPTSLPVFQITAFQYTNEEISTIARFFGFSSNPVKKTVDSSFKLVWSLPSKSLSFYSDGLFQNWSFTSNLSSPLGQQGQLGAPAVGDIIKTTFSFPSGLQLTLGDVTSGPFDGLPIDDVLPVTLSGFSYSALIDSTYPLVSQNFNKTIASVVIDNTGGVRSLVYSAPPIITRKETRQTISVDDAVFSLNKNLGLLVSAQIKTGNAYWGTPPTFQSVKLTTVSLVYYQHPTQNIALPFFLFDGEAATNEGVVEVRYAVSAIE